MPRKTKENKNGVFYVAISLFAVFAIAMGVRAVADYNRGISTANGDINIENYNEAESRVEAENQTLGVAAGPDYYGEYFHVHAPLRGGGKTLDATSTVFSNFTLTASQMCNYSIIEVNTDASNADRKAEAVTMTLTATSTLFTECLQNDGDYLSFLFVNHSPTAASSTTIAAGAGMDLLECDDSSDCNVVIGGLGRAKIEVWRDKGAATGTDAYALITEYTAAD